MAKSLEKIGKTSKPLPRVKKMQDPIPTPVIEKADPKEVCPQCGQKNFAIATDGSRKRFCNTKGCGKVWALGVEGVQSRGDLVLRQAQKENQELKDAINRIRKANEALAADNEKLKDQIANLRRQYEPEEIYSDSEDSLTDEELLKELE